MNLNEGNSITGPGKDSIRRIKDFLTGDGGGEETAENKDSENRRFVIRDRKKRRWIAAIATIVFAVVYYYIKLPAINLRDKDFLIYLFVVGLFHFAFSAVTSGFKADNPLKAYIRFGRRESRPMLWLMAAALLILLLGSFLSLKIFWAGKYSRLIQVDEGEFTSDVGEIGFQSIPILDASSAAVLGDRTLGELSDMVSQFEVSSSYNQINYAGRPVRVTYLLYGDFIKWWINQQEGIPGYIVVDMTNQEATFVRTERSIRISTSEYFQRDLIRYLRFRYPTYMFSTPTFEIDDEGNCFWICPRIQKKVGWFGGSDVVGVVLVDACTGAHTYYDADSAPDWIDHVYSDALIVEQYNNYGRLHNGWLNSYFGQKDVTVTSSGTNYIAMNDDVYMYTGVTSVGNDQANIGFILTNQRTKETRFYNIAGATETSAMNSAEGVVQHLNYDAAFPLLLNVKDQPTYFMALKDSSSLVKMFAMVNVQQYHIVATGTTVAECMDNYTALLMQNGIPVSDSSVRSEEAPAVNEAGTASSDGFQQSDGVLAEIRSAVRDGNSYYFFRLEGEEVFYVFDVSDSWLAAVLNPGDSVRIIWADQTPRDGLITAESVARR